MNQLMTALSQRSESNSEIINVDEPSIKIVLVNIGAELFAFLGHQVKEILVEPPIYFVPGCPDSLEGVINVRGNIESVIRLHKILNVTAKESMENSHVLLTKTQAFDTGIHVESVIDMLDIIESNLQVPPSTLPKHLNNFVCHIFKYQDKSIAVLDLEKILNEYAKGLG